MISFSEISQKTIIKIGRKLYAPTRGFRD